MNKQQIEKSIARSAFPDYRGHKISVNISGEVHFYNMNWDGGTKNEYRAVRIGDGAVRGFPDLAPWMNPVEGKCCRIPEGWAVVEQSYFCGAGPRLRVYLAAPDAVPGYPISQMATTVAGAMR